MSSSFADLSLSLYTFGQSAWVVGRGRRGIHRVDRRRDERGEGVISAAIVVLIMAAIGALMWTAFREIWQGIESDTRSKTQEIGD
jgi:hypothetical protein